jgi:copper homeostasis protein
MESQIKYFKQFNVAGFVFGCLQKDASIDIAKTQRLCDIAYPFRCTFHKAIDEVVDLKKAIKDLNSIKGIQYVLSSGTKKTAIEGASLLNNMIEWSADHIKIIAAGKITHQNLEEAQSKINTNYFHGKLIV